MEEKKQLSMKEKLDALVEESEKRKKKKFRMPRRGRISRSKMRKGYTIIMRIDDNGNVDFEKQKIIDSTYRLSTKEYHVAKKDDILSYKGKPLIIQPVKKINPYNPLDGRNETYGQKYIMARMLGDVIRMKGAGAKPLLWIIGLGIVGYILYSVFTGGI